jgi:CRP/FNR family nitrogen fixation transcriptional regulator
MSNSRSFVDERTIKRALAALRWGPIRFRRDKVIACEGEAGDYMFLVVSRVVRSCKTFANGNRNVVAFYLPGDLLGWSDENYSLSVEAASEALVLFLKRSTLMSLAASELSVAGWLLDATTTQFCRAQKHALLLSLTAKSRFATFLTDLMRRSGRANTIDLPMSHRDIADHLGLSIESLSRTITDMQRSGIIARSGRRTLDVENNHLLERASR